MSGYIEIIIGNMFSGKTTKLLKRYKFFKIAGKKCVIIKYHLDTRYSTTGIATHDMLVNEKDVISLENLSDLKNVNEFDVILVDEGQFFKNIVEFAEKWANMGKIVVVCGLDGDFKREKFGDLTDLIPKAEKVKKIAGICGMCKTGGAAFTKKKDEKCEKNIGGSDLYISVCRECYFK